MYNSTFTNHHPPPLKLNSLNSLWSDESVWGLTHCLSLQKLQMVFTWRYSPDQVDSSQPDLARGLRLMKTKSEKFNFVIKELIVVMGPVTCLSEKNHVNVPFYIWYFVTFSLLKRNEVITLINRDNLCTEMHIMKNKSNIGIKVPSLYF